MLSIKHCSRHRKSSFISPAESSLPSFRSSFIFPIIVNSGIFTVYILRMTVLYLQPVERDKKQIEEMPKPCSLFL